MAKLTIAKFPDEEKLLRKRCEPILKITDKTRKLIDDMIETMYDAAGVGLAGPQVFAGQRLFVYDVGEGPDALINPEIVRSEGEEVGTEGCLSIPRLQGDVPRFTKLTVTGLNRHGKRVKIDAEDFLARVFQHEIDHLNGVLFIDRAIKESLHLLTDEEEGERREQGKRRKIINRGAGPAPAE
jgi:peptide deformylase